VAGQLPQTEEKHFVDVYRRNPTSLDGLEQQILGTFAPSLLSSAFCRKVLSLRFPGCRIV
jgi:hypothetical protein